MTSPTDHPVDLDSLSIWNATVRVRVETRFAKIRRRYVTQREASALLGELIRTSPTTYGINGSLWAFALWCQTRLQSTFRQRGIAVGRRNTPKPRNRPGTFAELDRKALELRSTAHPSS